MRFECDGCIDHILERDTWLAGDLDGPHWRSRVHGPQTRITGINQQRRRSCNVVIGFRGRGRLQYSTALPCQMRMSYLEQLAFCDNPSRFILREERRCANLGLCTAPDYLRVSGMLPEKQLVVNKCQLTSGAILDQKTVPRFWF
jgi:hypothetical protein